MARGASCCFLFSFLSVLIVCSNGNVAPPKTAGTALDSPLFHGSHRELLTKSKIKANAHEETSSTALLPTSPPLTTPITTPPDTSTPTIVTIPSTNPTTVSLENPASTVPPTTPVNIPPVNPFNSPLPITNPATTPSVPFPGTQPVSNPATTYPNTPANPVTTPVTNPVMPPATTNAPAIPGQSWCVAKPGVAEAALQAALDYACGMGGADCSQIQQSGSCYNPTTIQNHASYAFNSYYQKNPGADSCDFGGAAMITNTNPSSGSCVYPSSSSSASTSSMSPPTTNPATTPPTTTSSPTTGMGFPGDSTPPSALNSSNPASAATTGFGTESLPPTITTPGSESTGLQPLVNCIILVTFSIARNLMLCT